MSVKAAKVARVAGVSPATVSRVLRDPSLVNPATRSKVLSTMEELDFRAVNNQTEKVSVIGITNSDLHPGCFDYSYQREMISGIMESTFKSKVGVKIIDLSDLHKIDRRPGAFRRFLKAEKVDAILHMIVSEYDRDLIEAIAEDGVRQIVFEQRFENDEIGWVEIDNYNVCKELAVFLSKFIKDDYAIVTAPRKYKGHFQRYSGFVDGLEENGIYLSPENNIERDVFSIDAGSSATINLLMPDKSTPRVIFYTNIELAIGGLRTLLRFGLKVPEDVVVCVFDDAEDSKMLPLSVISISQPVYKLGSEMAIQLTLENAELPQSVIEPELFISDDIHHALLDNIK